MKRFFTFGCSFTDYYWMTWANIIGHGHFDHVNIKNYGRAGAGNQYIFNRLIHAIAEHNICETDTVMIMWTNVLREDRYIRGDWVLSGNLYTSSFFDEDFREKYADIDGCYERDIPMIHAAQILLDNIGCEHRIMSMVDIINYDQYDHFDYSDNIKHLTDKFSDSLQRILPSAHNVIFNYDYESRKIPGLDIRVDVKRDYGFASAHPLPLEHLYYIEQVLPEYTISDKQKQDIKLENDQVITHLKKMYQA